MQGLATAFAVMRKDLCDFLSNRALLVSLLATILIAVGFVKLSERMSRAVRVDLVGGSMRLRAELAVAQVFQVNDSPDEAAATEAVRQGRADFGLVLPKDFDDAMLTPNKPSITIIHRQDASPRTVVGLTALVEMLRVHAGQEMPVRLDVRPLGVADTTRGKARSVAGWLLFVLMMGMTMVAGSLVEERERGTLQAIMVTRARLWSVLAGKALCGFVICLLATLAIVVGSGSSFPSWPVGMTLLVAGATFSVVLGLWLGTLFPNLASANAGLSLVFLVLFVPVFLADVLPQTLLGVRWTSLLPSANLLDGLQMAFQRSSGWVDLQGPLVVLVGWTALAGAASWLWMRAHLAR